MNQEANNLNEMGREIIRQGYAILAKDEIEEKGPALFKQAEGYFRKAHDLDPLNGHYQLNIADLLFAQGRRDEANVHFQDATKISKLIPITWPMFVSDGQHPY